MLANDRAGFCAKSFAIFSAASLSSAKGTTLSTIPSFRACCAVISLSESSISNALPAPSLLERKKAPPPFYRTSIDWLLPTIVLLSTSAQYRVKSHMVSYFGQAERDKPLLRRIEGSLRIKDAQVAVNPLCIAFI